MYYKDRWYRRREPVRLIDFLVDWLADVEDDEELEKSRLPKAMTEPQTSERLKIADPASMAIIIVAIDSIVSELDDNALTIHVYRRYHIHKILN